MKKILTARARLLAAVRAYFEQAGVLEVSTPVLSFAGNTDAAIESFVAHYRPLATAADGKPMYLHTSPEFFMKRLLCTGSGSIYQIAPVFRNGESGRLHNPEFSLLEWYRVGFDQHQLMQDVAALVNRLLPEPVGVDSSSYQSVFEQWLGFNPHIADTAQFQTAAADAGISVTDETVLTKNDWLELLMSQVIEPKLAADRLTFIYDYPASQASLAKIRQDVQPVAERFELYYQGVELANGFHELQDVVEQRNRFAADNRLRQQRGLAEVVPDEALIAALEKGLPDCSGVALGLDRLLMIILGARQLADVMAFPLTEV